MTVISFLLAMHTTIHMSVQIHHLQVTPPPWGSHGWINHRRPTENCSSSIPSPSFWLLLIKSEVFPHHIAQMETCHHTTSAEDRKSSWRFWLLFLPYAHRAAFHFSNTNLLLQWTSNVSLPWSLPYSHSQASQCFDNRLPILEVVYPRRSAHNHPHVGSSSSRATDTSSPWRIGNCFFLAL